MDLRAYRKSRGLSQTEAARALGVESKGYICDIEKGRRPASLLLALKIEQWSGGKVKAATLNPKAAELAQGAAA